MYGKEKLQQLCKTRNKSVSEKAHITEKRSKLTRTKNWTSKLLWIYQSSSGNGKYN